MPADRRENRGPLAAGPNRRALVAAAREVFADVGLDAPLSAVARRAGVGQGSLYRHFPDRVSLAIAVFEDNVTEFEARAAQPGATLHDLLGLITDRAIDSAAFVEMVSPSMDDPRLAGIGERVADALDSTLPAARADGSVRADLSIHEVFLAVEMVASLLAKTPAEQRRATADDAWTLLRGGMAPTHLTDGGVHASVPPDAPAGTDPTTPATGISPSSTTREEHR